MRVVVSVLLFALVLSTSITFASADLQAKQNYLLSGGGFVLSKSSVADSNIDMHLTTNSDYTKQLTFENGIISISGNGYIISKGLAINTLRDGKFFTISGYAEDENGNKINISFFGRLVETNSDGSIYNISGRIVLPDQTFKVAYSAKIGALVQTSVTPEVTMGQQTTKKNNTEANNTQVKIQQNVTVASTLPSAKIILIAKHTSPTLIAYTYTIFAKVYYADQNPTRDMEQNYGYVQDAHVTVKIIDANGMLAKAFEGTTDTQGTFIASFRIPDNFQTGTYKVMVSAQKGDQSDGQELPLNIESNFWLR